jgi:hypothetical protein
MGPDKKPGFPNLPDRHDDCHPGLATGADAPFSRSDAY